jgi:predicted metalloprotease with PDZ domain
MMRRRFVLLLLAFVFVGAGDRSASLLLAQAKLEPLVYTLSFPDPASKTFNVDVVVPTGKRATVDLMMAIWSPGFYGLQNYADRVTTFSAKAADGTALEATKSSPSRWTVTTGGRASFTFSYTVSAPRGGNLGNGVTETGAVIIGPSTYHAVQAPNASPRRSAPHVARDGWDR